uniref:Probable disease resistance protein At5g66900 n=1 Tax=Nicotiana tabacum TaxID=4097 RepID=A0A1S4BGS9_TOBAC|nr:PREDICTED: probable disease resistance protein At5g66900 [Nicotiana tabacum]
MFYRKDAPACLGLYNVHYITQHDLLRELAIHRCDEKPVEERRRLYVNIKGNDFPKWWFDQRLQPVQARLLSIFTEETFSIDWYDMQFPYAEVLVLNFQTTVCTYKLPQFMEKMSQLKALIVTNNGFSLAELSNFSVLCSSPNLNRINLERISIASIFTGNLQLTNLRKISLIMCEVGKAFSNSVVKMSSMWPNLVEMSLEYCNDLVILPADICDLVHLKKLSICYCQELIALPEEVGKLENLEILRVQSCTKLTELPESIVKHQRLCFLDVYDCVDMDSMPMEIGQLSVSPANIAVFINNNSGKYKLLYRICMGSRLGFDELPRSVINLVKLEHVICDEETALLWEQYKGCLRNLRINVLKEDINLNLICCINHHLI